MKYDEKSGSKVPESRIDEISISNDNLKELMEKNKFPPDRSVEIAWILRDINISLALLVDMAATAMNRSGMVVTPDPAKGNQKKQ